MRTALEQGRFGKISHGSIHVRWNRDKGYYDQAVWRGTWEQDGGALMNQCIHGIDLLRWMMGDEIVEVYGKTKQQFHNYLEAEDLGMAVVTFKNGAIGTIEGTTNVYPKNLEETLYLFGENGTVKIGGTSTNNIDVWDFSDNCAEDKENKGLTEVTSNVYGNGHTILFADMIESIKTIDNHMWMLMPGKCFGISASNLSICCTRKTCTVTVKNCNTMDFVGRFENE